MAEIKAFGALRFTPAAGPVEELVCPPYDIIPEEEREAYLARNPRNIIRLELPREGEEPYGVAGDTLKEWLEEGFLAPDGEEGLYVYEEEFTAHGGRKKVKGLVCRVRLEEFEKGVVLPHEETLSKAKTDRFNLMCATACNFSSIYSLYFDGDRQVRPKIDAASGGAPEMEFSTPDGIVHRVWRICGQADVAAISAAMADKKLYIADGHHRYETALNYKKHLEKDGPLPPNHPANYIMMTLVNMEDPGLVVFPTHRIVRRLPDFSVEKLLAAAAGYFSIAQIPEGEIHQKLEAAAGKGEKAFVLYTSGQAVLLALKDQAALARLLPDKSSAYQGLDVTVLHTLVLEGMLGIDKANMAAQKNLTYTRDVQEAMDVVNKGEANCAFLINPTRVDEIAAVAGAGEKMPQKSTYFYPKLITGHIMNLLFFWEKEK